MHFFAELVREIHARGMKVILDGVFNHCGSFNKWLDREKIYHANGGYEDGAFLSKESLTAVSSVSGMKMAGRITPRMRAGGIMTRCQN